MEIEKTSDNDNKQVGDLVGGDVFVCASGVFVKVYLEHRVNFNVVRLCDGEAFDFNTDRVVTPLPKAKLVI